MNSHELDKENDELLQAVSQRKEQFRVNIRAQKLRKIFTTNRQISQNNTHSLESDSEFLLQPSKSSTDNPLSSSHLSAYPIEKVSTQIKNNLQYYQQLRGKGLSCSNLNKLQKLICLAVEIEQSSLKPILNLPEIQFLVSAMSSAEVPIESKAAIIDILAVLVSCPYIQQHIIQYLLQYLHSDQPLIVKKVLEQLQMLIAHGPHQETLLFKLLKPFFVKIALRLLGSKVQRISLITLDILTMCLGRDSQNTQTSIFFNNLWDNRLQLFKILEQLLSLEEAAHNISKLLDCFMWRNEEYPNKQEELVQGLIDTNVIKSAFEIVKSQKNTQLRRVLVIIFIRATHFQIEHYFEENLKEFLLQEGREWLEDNAANECALLILQLIHHLLDQEKQFNQKSYFPKKKFVESSILHSLIVSLTQQKAGAISNEAHQIISFF